MFKKLPLVALLAASWGAQAASPDELAQIRAQIAEMKQAYEQRIAALEQKLADSEAKAAVPAAQPPAEVKNAPSAASTANSFNPEVSLILQGQYLNAKDNGGRGITGFLPVGVDGNTRSRGFTLDATELVLAANVDPYWRGQAIVAMVDGTASVEEAWFQSLGLGNGFGLKLGRFRSGISYLNEQHPHMWDFADAPLMYQTMFGSEGSYGQDGVQAKWLAPTDLFIEFGAEVGRGANFPGSDRNKNGNGATALFAHIGGDAGPANEWRAGLSLLRTSAQARESLLNDAVNGVDALGRFTGDSNTLIADFVWKWAPNGNPKYQNFKFQTEAFQRREKGDLACADADTTAPTSCNGVVDAYRSRQSGWYAQGVYQFTPNWRAGLRYEQLTSGSPSWGLNSAAFAVDAFKPQKTSAMIDYSWSEFSRMRLQVARDESIRGLTDHQITLQYIMSLGAHGAHKF
ncbi:MAG: TonB-dependent receptor [Rhodocyclales bacterium]|nr:TonB-dependent receptor [Rhodocyclales bacterium]